MARLLGIAIKPQRGEAMRLLSHARLSLEAGVEGDSRGRPGPRQVTLMSLAAWREACAVLGDEHLPWVGRRANLLVDEMALEGRVGAHIRLGDALLEVTGETDPCSRMEALRPGLFEALAREWRGGVTCRVLSAGALELGMRVGLE